MTDEKKQTAETKPKPKPGSKGDLKTNPRDMTANRPGSYITR